MFQALRGCLHGGEEGPQTSKILEGEKLFIWFTCRNFGRGGYYVLKEARRNRRPLAAERPPAAMFVFLVPSTRTFRAKVVYMVLGSSYLSARKILSLERS